MTERAGVGRRGARVLGVIGDRLQFVKYKQGNFKAKTYSQNLASYLGEGVEAGRKGRFINGENTR